MARVLAREGAMTVSDLAERLSKSRLRSGWGCSETRQRFIRLGEKVGVLERNYA